MLSRSTFVVVALEPPPLYGRQLVGGGASLIRKQILVLSKKKNRKKEKAPHAEPRRPILHKARICPHSDICHLGTPIPSVFPVPVGSRARGGGMALERAGGAAGGGVAWCGSGR